MIGCPRTQTCITSRPTPGEAGALLLQHLSFLLPSDPDGNRLLLRWRVGGCFVGLNGVIQVFRFERILVIRLGTSGVPSLFEANLCTPRRKERGRLLVMKRWDREGNACVLFRSIWWRWSLNRQYYVRVLSPTDSSYRLVQNAADGFKRPGS